MNNSRPAITPLTIARIIICTTKKQDSKEIRLVVETHIH